ncbi:substrate-binding periplasmic protein [Candidatus Contubernalis alkaliaceticus]|uniref:substrate-binding periplasmic protein n=1 Tax=Candidatus Contubernalis alkaliaceticus TaxID=338645 RepID=UPI001F4C3733|nr:transporter substrate-binding domain-containing protein [Candidatus Contubernalis alkalaceticus]UNC93491.1 transporter substrate-binding domain-containing protein [Candidatus Contubernalis alkalaceticus]
MKKKSIFLFIIMVTTLMVITLIGCSGRDTAEINSISDLEGKVMGALSSAASTEEYEELVELMLGVKPKEILYFNRGSDIITAILTGKIDAAPEMGFIADYYVERNNNLKIVELEQIFETQVVMIVRSEDESLKEDLDRAIMMLQENGTLKTLEDKWIKNLSTIDEPTNKEIPKIENAKTIYVGISGDYVPLDYIRADGEPAGYNVAILTEIGEILNINFEFVQVEAQAKYSALMSKKTDVVFCQVYTPEIAALFSDNYLMTKPYFTDESFCIVTMK